MTKKSDNVEVNARVFTVSRWNPRDKNDGNAISEMMDFVELNKMHSYFARWAAAPETLPGQKSKSFPLFLQGKSWHVRVQRII